MSQGVFQPVGQKRLTNVAVVRYKKGGKRFEIACYKNKVVNWRNGVEKDLDEVLQSTTVYSNVSKGVLARKEDLQSAFGTADEQVICREILAKGDLQVSDKERKMELTNLFRDVASVLVDKCVDPQMNRPYTITMIERALKDAHFNPDLKRSAKQQALEVALPLLQQTLPIERAKMRVRIQVPVHCRAPVAQMLQDKAAVVESSSSDNMWFVAVVLVEPGAFRDCHSFVTTNSEGEGRLQVLAVAANLDTPQAELVQLALSAGPRPSDSSAVTARPEASEGGPAPGSRPPRGRDDAVAAGAAEHGGPRAGRSVVYGPGPIADLPSEYANRKEMFLELDRLQPGWTVELRSRGDGESATVDASFLSPSGERAGAFSVARRAALKAKKAMDAAVA